MEHITIKRLKRGNPGLRKIQASVKRWEVATEVMDVALKITVAVMIAHCFLKMGGM